MKEIAEAKTGENEELWNKVRSGNEKAYSLLYQKYANELFSFGSRLSPDRELVKDCIQNIFVRIFQNRKNLAATSNVRFYLMLALKNELYQAFRKDKNVSFAEFNPSFLVTYTVNNQAVDDEETRARLEEIARMLNVLPPRQKEIIYYRFIEELSLDEIGQMMGINYQSAQNLIQRALKKLRLEFASPVVCGLFFYSFSNFFLCR
ncbi:RNA polymerase sigma factor, sigma-70 family [Mariniphaga anaerophila]|uniref:RNA polymerase sigma factor, sigma-70 family n=1 Tax=Mariniphaga anaerophila TaxID=1484053 RepID=A0A1M4W949_9BACT|nr:sigma-70 family RNA polymerase sigma factor [Mariniphaga anaerophila]SHE77788.1 RNA polymerase sigma factor, sigma-70 family [Mariniphaga anaerophila]